METSTFYQCLSTTTELDLINVLDSFKLQLEEILNYNNDSLYLMAKFYDFAVIPLFLSMKFDTLLNRNVFDFGERIIYSSISNYSLINKLLRDWDDESTESNLDTGLFPFSTLNVTFPEWMKFFEYLNLPSDCLIRMHRSSIIRSFPKLLNDPIMKQNQQSYIWEQIKQNVESNFNINNYSNRQEWCIQAFRDEIECEVKLNLKKFSTDHLLKVNIETKNNKVNTCLII